jgi:glyoxylase-like metal-dependent hydrolase (beta-lactamase superfamily II)
MPLAVDRYELGPIRTNCYVVRRDPSATAAVVIDPSGDALPLLQGLTCAGILVTHTHWDHLLGLADLVAATGAPVWAPRSERDRLAEPDGAGHRLRVPAHDPEHLVAGGDTVSVAGIDFEVVDVPGHTAGHVAFYADEALFSGDVLFAGSVGRTDLAGGDERVLIESISLLMRELPADTVVAPGHGPVTTLGDELKSNPFLAELR